MKQEQLAMQLEILLAAYPYAWPKDVSQKAVLLVWFKQFGHLPNEIMEKAVQRCIDTLERFSVASMWDCILDVCGFPTKTQLRHAINYYTDNPGAMRQRAESPIFKSELFRTTMKIMGDAYDIRTMRADHREWRFNEAFTEARIIARAVLIKPENVERLKETYTLSMKEGTPLIGPNTAGE